jgi:hypothetical protein
MRQMAIVLLLSLVFLNGCGGSNSGPAKSDTMTGSWTATLAGTPVVRFNTTLMQNSPTDVTVTDFGFQGPVSCFTAFAGRSATFNSTGIVNGNITGSFTFTVTTLFPGPAQNVLVLQGSVNGPRIDGTWNRTGGATILCDSASGTFTMTKN